MLGQYIRFERVDGWFEFSVGWYRRCIHGYSVANSGRTIPGRNAYLQEDNPNILTKNVLNRQFHSQLYKLWCQKFEQQDQMLRRQTDGALDLR